MRAWLYAVLAAAVLAGAGCAETERCPDASVFDDDGRCVPIPDAGAPRDAAPADGG